LNARGLWLFAHDWFERLAPFGPRLRGPLAAYVNEAYDAMEPLWSLAPLPFVPVVQLDVLADDARAVLRCVEANPFAVEIEREQGRAKLSVEGLWPLEIWRRAGPSDALPLLGAVATAAPLTALVERYCSNGLQFVGQTEHKFGTDKPLQPSTAIETGR
jgi:hypothetical protein